MAEITVGDLLSEAGAGLGLSLAAGGKGLDRVLVNDRPAKPGLHLTGFFEHFEAERLQVFGQAEQAYLASLPADEVERRLRAFFELKPVAVVFTAGTELPPILPALAEELAVAVLLTALDSTAFAALVGARLEEFVAPKTTLHGVLMDVFGVGILMTGESGIGKSEVGLDLILRGHRFVADDVVEIIRRNPGVLIGRGAELIRYHIESHGLGILNVKDLFGVAAVRDRKKIELLIEFIPWEKTEHIERVGLDEKTKGILGVALPHLQVPVSPGRNMASIVEVAARNQLLRLQGIHSAKEFQERLLRDLSARAQGPLPGGDEIE